MDAFKRFLKSLPVILLGAAIIYGLWLLIKNFWDAIIFYLLVVPGIIIPLTIIFYLRRKGIDAAFITKEIEKAELKGKIFHFLKSTATKLLIFPTVFINWPLLVVIGIRESKRTEDIRDGYVEGATALTKKNFMFSSYSLILVALIYVMNFLLPNAWNYTQAFLIILIISTTSRHISYLFSSEGLPGQLRKTSGNPYLRFILIALFDYLILILSFGGILYMKDWSFANMSNFLNIISGMKIFDDIKNIAGISGLKPVEILIGISGLFYSTTLLQLIFKFKNFRRTDKDILSIAFKYTLMSRYNEALKWIKKLKNQSTASDMQKIPIYVGLNEIEEAFRYARHALEAESQNVTDDEIFELVWSTSALLSRVHKKLVLAILRKGMSLDVTDSILSNAVGISFAINAAIIEDFEDILEDRDMREKFPLTISTIFLMCKMKDRALEMLENYTPRSVIDEVHFYYILLMLNVLDQDAPEEVEKLIDNWFEEYIPRIKSLIKNINKENERVSVFGILNSFKFLVSEFQPYRIEQVTSIIENVISSSSDKDKFKKFSITQNAYWEKFSITQNAYWKKLLG
jgi:hypothetical protein